MPYHQAEEFSSWIVVDRIRKPGITGVAEVSKKKDRANDNPSQREDAKAVQQKDTKFFVDGTVAEQAKEKPSTWVLVNFIHRPGPEAKSLTRHEENKRELQQKDIKALVGDNALEETKEKLSSWVIVSFKHRCNLTNTINADDNNPGQQEKDERKLQ